MFTKVQYPLVAQHFLIIN